MSIARPSTTLVIALAFLGACSPSGHVAKDPGSAVARDARIEDAFDTPPDLLLVVRPVRLARDPLYGPLLRSVSRIASARSAIASAAGTTALAALERSDEVLVAVNDPDARDAIVAVRGVPADVDVARVVDTDGHALWTPSHDLARGVSELAPADGSHASLFVLPSRAWIIAVGDAVDRVRSRLVDPSRGSSKLPAIDDAPLAFVRMRADAIVRARPRLAEGALAPVLNQLDTVTLSLEPGPQGQIGEVAARFVYLDEPSAGAGASMLQAVVTAFTTKYEKKAPWLHAVTVTRADRAVLVRGRIPRAWAEGFASPDVDLSL